MTPIRVVTISEWLPGCYTVECDGRKRDLTSREELRMYLNRELGELPDPRVEELEVEIDQLRENLLTARSDRYGV